MSDIDRDWKITVEMVFQYAAAVTGTADDENNFDLLDSVKAEISSPDDFLYIESEDVITSGDYDIEGTFWDYSDVVIRVVLEAENGTFSEAKKIFIDQLLTAKFSFKKDERIKVEFHRINRWVFSSVEDSSSGLTHILGGLLPENGEELEFEKELFGAAAGDGRLWLMDEKGSLRWASN